MNKVSTLAKLLIFILYQQLLSQNYTLSGYVKDRDSGDLLIGANVYIEGTSIGSSTDKGWFYKLENLKDGIYIIKHLTLDIKQILTPSVYLVKILILI